MKALLDLLHTRAADFENFPDALVLLNGGPLAAIEGHAVLGRFKKVVSLEANPEVAAGNQAFALAHSYTCLHGALVDKPGKISYYSFNFPKFDGFSSLDHLRSRWPDQCGDHVHLTHAYSVEGRSLQSLFDECLPEAQRVAVLYNASFDTSIATSLLRQAAQLPVQLCSILFSKGVQFSVDSQTDWSVSGEAYGITRDIRFLAEARRDVCPPEPPRKTVLEEELERELIELKRDGKQQIDALEERYKGELAALQCKLDTAHAERDHAQEQAREMRVRLEEMMAESARQMTAVQAKFAAEKEHWVEDSTRATAAIQAKFAAEKEQWVEDSTRATAALQAKFAAEKEQWVAESQKTTCDLEIALKKESLNLATVTQQKDNLERDLKRARDELISLRQENATLAHQNQELSTRQRLMNEELVKADAQMGLIKDLLLRERDIL